MEEYNADHTCYWIEPISILKRVLKFEGFDKVVGLILVLMNWATLGIFKIIISKRSCKRHRYKFILKLWRK